MKSRFDNLTLREQRYVLLGGLALSILLIYFLIFAPLQNNVSLLRSAIKKDTALLAWMVNADKKIIQSQHSKPLPSNYHSLLSDVQSDIQSSPLASHLSEFKQGGPDSVMIKFDKVSFDSFSRWLTTVVKEKHLTLAELTVIPSDKKGVVEVNLTLTN